MPRVSLIPRRLIAAYAALTASVPLICVLTLAWRAPLPRPPVATLSVASGDRAEEAAVAEERELAGIWRKQVPGTNGAPVAFYYFHGDGHGLYRYGRVGHTLTRSFDYSIRGDRLTLLFRKSGERFRVPFSVTREDNVDWLTLEYDPQEQSHGVRYFREQAGPIAPHGTQERGRIGGRMWIDLQRYATGGQGFLMYQFAPAALDGRGVGWFHRGDFDDWSTESFTYRLTGDQLELHFTLADATAQTRVTWTAGDPPKLRLHHDPRDFWKHHDYVDMGESFDAGGLWPNSRPFVGP